MTPKPSPGEPLLDISMTTRARGYLAVDVVFHGIVGLTCLFAADRLAAPSFRFIADLLPFQVWALGFLVTAAVCLYALVRSSEDWARLGLVASAVLTAVWAGGFMAALADVPLDQPAPPTGVAAWLAIAAKDLIVCRQPLRSPFEPLIRRLAGER